jgi:type 1 glutamine amidotransferase
MGEPTGRSWRTVARVAVGALVAVALTACAAGSGDGAAPFTGGTRGPATGTASPGSTAPIELASVVVFTATAGFRHESIEPAAAVLRDRLAADGVAVEVTADARVFTDRLAGVDAVVLLSSTGDVLDGDQQDALLRWVETGGGLVGVHAALDAEYGWSDYETLLGAWFASHPAVQPATVRVEGGPHPATAHLPATWPRTDEWYDLRTNPRDDVRVLATVDESTYEGGAMGADHPIAWCAAVGAGQTFTTAMGHTVASWADPVFVDHVLGGVVSVAQPGSCR